MDRTCLGRERDDGLSGFYWPQRNYNCSFCKRKFNSAQALGGHMNVHRRDRAMLLQLPSCAFQCPNLYTAKSRPNPSFSPSTSSSWSYHCPHRNTREVVEVLKKSEVISLELELGCKDTTEVLDLELRLGCF